MTRSFHFDSASCSGCKACQVACKDKHDLEVGRLWRRVYEICGGGWVRKGKAWENDVFAYHLSVSCNHCEKPICVEACPTGAMKRRADGVVYVEQADCAGCRYCSMACPYDAPQLAPTIGKMTKCDFCRDEVDRGRPPACVSACPMRALEFGEKKELEAAHGTTPAVFPLPDRKLTEPSLVITPHEKTHLATSENSEVANREEV